MRAAMTRTLQTNGDGTRPGDPGDAGSLPNTPPHHHHHCCSHTGQCWWDQKGGLDLQSQFDQKKERKKRHLDERQLWKKRPQTAVKCTITGLLKSDGAKQIPTAPMCLKWNEFPPWGLIKLFESRILFLLSVVAQVEEIQGGLSFFSQKLSVHCAGTRAKKRVRFGKAAVTDSRLREDLHSNDMMMLLQHIAPHQCPLPSAGLE